MKITHPEFVRDIVAALDGVPDTLTRIVDIAGALEKVAARHNSDLVWDMVDDLRDHVAKTTDAAERHHANCPQRIVAEAACLCDEIKRDAALEHGQPQQEGANHGGAL